MSSEEHNFSCFCGQPLKEIESPVSANCPRCGVETLGLVATPPTHRAQPTGG